jgi:amino acid transporter
MGIVIFSLLVTAVLVFTGLFFLFRKFNSKTKPMSNIYYWITAFIATPTFYIVFLFIWFFASSSYETQEFNKKNWTENRDSRYVYVDDLIESGKLIGLTSSELKNMLGEADYEDDSIISYYIGYSPKHFLNMDPDWLETDLIDGKVSHTYVRE